MQNPALDNYLCGANLDNYGGAPPGIRMSVCATTGVLTIMFSLQVGVVVGGGVITMLLASRWRCKAVPAKTAVDN